MKIAKTLLLLSAFLVGNYFIANEFIDFEHWSVPLILMIVILISAASIVVIFTLLAMFALFYNILGMDN